KCVPLDPADFAERPWVPGSGWPMSRRDLQPWYDRACDLLEIPRFGPGETGWEDPARPTLEIERGRIFSAPRAFTKYTGLLNRAAYDRYRLGPTEAANVSVYLDVNVTELRLAGDRRSIERLDLACLD